MGEKKRKREAIMRDSPTANFVFRYTDRANDSRHEAQPCLGCGKMLDAASALQKGGRPSENCFSICAACGHLQKYGPDLKFVPLSDDDMVEIAGSPQIVAVNNVRGQLREFWQRDDSEGAYEFILGHIRKEVRRTRERR